MIIKVKSYSQESSLLSSIIFFILGALLVARTEEVFLTITKIFGSIFLIFGIVELITYIVNYKKGYKQNFKIFLFLISTIMAVLFLFFNDIIKIAFNFLIGGWILLSGITRLVSSFGYKRKLPLIILSILLILTGSYTILNGTDILLSLIGTIMIIYAVFEIIGFILYTKEEPITKEEPKEETKLVAPEKANKRKLLKRKPKIKDVDVK